MGGFEKIITASRYNRLANPPPPVFYDSIKVEGYSPRTNCNSCAAPIRYSRCEYCGNQTGITASMPLSKSEKIRIENQFLSAVQKQLPKRGLLERFFDRYIYALMGIR